MIVEFVDDPHGRPDARGAPGQIGVISGAWSGSKPERLALDLLGGLRLQQKHSAPLQINDVGHSDCRWWATFEAIRGLDLLDWRALTPDRREAQVAPWVIFHAARFLMERGHDWSQITRPEHLLLCETGELRVADFEAYQRGACDSLVDEGRPATDWHDMLAPELFRTKARTETMMVYALGVLLTFLCTGRRPLRKQSAKITVREAIDRSAPMSQLLALPPALAPVIDAATDPSDQKRLLTLKDLELELEPLIPSLDEIRAAIHRAMSLRAQPRESRLRFCF